MKGKRDTTKLTVTEILLRTEEGDSFYTSVADTAVSSYARRAGIKVRTERLLVIHAGKREMSDITRVTVLKKPARLAPAAVKEKPRVRQRRTV